MQASNIPAKFPLPWANNAGPTFINTIPTASQIPTNNGFASLTDGFPPLNSTPVAAGGVPPRIQDWNGILHQVTQWNQWQQVGGPVTYDATFQTAVGGYPNGAIVQSVTTPGLYWRSTADNNATNPDTGGSGWSEVRLMQGQNLQVFASSTTLVFPTGVTKVKYQIWAGGGGGGGTFGVNSGGGGGGGGGYAAGIATVVPGQSYVITVGGSGTAGNNGSTPTAGGAGGASSFGSFASATGGTGGGPANGNITGTVGTAGHGTGGQINGIGTNGATGISTGTIPLGGMGGGTFGTSNSQMTQGSIGSFGIFPGGGGGGGAQGNGGGPGAAGFVILEY